MGSGCEIKQDVALHVDIQAHARPLHKKKKSSREADAVQSKRRLQTPHQFLFRRCALKKEARKNVRLFVEI